MNNQIVMSYKQRATSTSHFALAKNDFVKMFDEFKSDFMYLVIHSPVATPW